jgi:hypothetical protein
VDVPGARPAAFKLVERAEDSFYLYRSSRKIGTARVEESGDWTARIETDDLRRTATAKSGPELLQLVGAYLLTLDARAAAARPVRRFASRAARRRRSGSASSSPNAPRPRASRRSTSA